MVADNWRRLSWAQLVVVRSSPAEEELGSSSCGPRAGKGRGFWLFVTCKLGAWIVSPVVSHASAARESKTSDWRIAGELPHFTLEQGTWKGATWAASIYTCLIRATK